jgi:hypothetical protein
MLSFPERLNIELDHSDCGRAVHHANSTTTIGCCPYCGETNISMVGRPDRCDEARIMPVNKFGIHPVNGRSCRTIALKINHQSYIACICCYPGVHAGKDLVEWYRGRWVEFECESCHEEFRKHLPMVQIPAPYIPEFTYGACMLEALKRRLRKRKSC